MSSSEHGHPALNTDKIAVLIAEDHTIVRDGLKTIIELQPDMRVVAEAGDGEAAVAAFFEHQPDMLLLDLELPKLSGVGVIEAIVDHYPDARILVLTTYDGDDDIFRSLRAGALGYLLKDVGRAELVAAIHSVYRGERVLPPALAGKIAARLSSGPDLTERELAVLRLMAEGKSNKAIASALHRSEGTIKTHVVRVLRKLEASGRTDAIAIARRRGLLRL